MTTAIHSAPQTPGAPGNPRDLAARLDELAAAHTTWRDGGTVNLNAATNSLSRRARAALSSGLADKGISSGLRSRHHQGGHGIRIGVQELTRHGLSPAQFQQVADAVAVIARGDPGRVGAVAAEMSALAAATATVYYDFERGLPPGSQPG